ncbi:hypothetical protein RFI_34884 [Reticulomyxa filosa]|uniref:Phosphoglycerate mutase family protein n=1 Tax=Reticulomyxa filosa TaxID=46433 RepID=X6LLP9_RETFI|nr:hypothetical protein RFI_34884 [Reticulomyxa filosa]|eukprot:ETO02544.1 hypothetical protein RFI_34884 [Reticulomyxa filosa]
MLQHRHITVCMKHQTIRKEFHSIIVRRAITNLWPQINQSIYGWFTDNENLIKLHSKVCNFWSEKDKHYAPGSGVFDRVSNFLHSLYRNFSDGPFGNKPDIKWNVVIVSHGLFMRLFLHRYFRWTVDEFEQVNNFGNCDICILRKKHTGPSMGSYRLETPLPKLSQSSSPVNNTLLSKSRSSDNNLQSFGYNRLGDIRKQDYEVSEITLIPLLNRFLHYLNFTQLKN